MGMKIPALIALVVACAIALLWYEGQRRDADARYTELVEQNQAKATLALAINDSLEVEAAAADARAAAAVAVADSIGRRARDRIARIDTVEVPAEAIPYTTPRDSIIFELLIESDTLRHAIREQRAVADRLRVANVLLESTVRLLQETLDARPKPRPRWLPKIVVGPCAGVSTELRPFVGGCVSAGWEISI